MPVLTLGEILELPVMRAGMPEVLAGSEALSRPVRWVHVSELDEFSALLRGGELVLTTGLALSADNDAQQRYVQDLQRVGACGVVLELGRHFAAAPAGLREAGRRLGFPVVVLHRPIRFVEVTERVHAAILDDQVQRLRFSQRVHQTFSTLGVEESSIPVILRHTRVLAGAPVVLEDLGHRVLDYDLGDAPPDRILQHWERRSRDAADSGVTLPLGNERWRVARVGPEGHTWGRLILVGSGPLDDEDAAMLLERAAQALALSQLLERDRQGLELRAHAGLLSELSGGGQPAPGSDLNARASALGLAPGAVYHALTLARRSDAGRAPGVEEPIAAGRVDGRVAEIVTAAARALRLSVLVAPLSPGTVSALVAHAEAEHAERDLCRLAEAVREHRGAAGDIAGEWVIGAGRPAPDLAAAGARLAESAHVARAAASLPRGGPERAFYRNSDVRLRGLLSLLRDDPRVLAFATAELAPLRAYDDKRGTALLPVLREYLRHGGHKTRVARSTHLSRATLYDRLAAIEELLDVDLSDPETVTSLHVAVMAHEMRH